MPEQASFRSEQRSRLPTGGTHSWSSGRSRIVHSSGQSGLTFSFDYRSFVPRWAHGGYLPLWGDGKPGQVLELVPR